MFAWLAAALVGALWRRSGRLCLWVPAPHAALLGGMLLALAYAVFSGWGIPSQRTVWMLAAVGLLRLSARQWPWPMVWLLVCAVVVAVDPWALAQAGFWLSFVAVGVLFASGPAVSGPAIRGSRARLIGLLREQGVITVALAPLTLLLFGQVSVVGLLANLLAIPWVTLLVTPLAMLGVVAPPAWMLAGACIEWMGVGLQWLAQWPWATVSVAQAPLWAGVAGVCGGLLLVLRAPWSLRLAGVPLMLPVLLWQAPRPVPGEFSLIAADIGQGNAVLVQTARHALLYDAGPRFSRESDAGHRVLVPLLRALDVRLDTLMLSHRDNDHVGGALAVLAMQGSAHLLSSVEQDHALQAVGAVQRCQAGQRWTWDGVEFAVLHPAPGDYASPARPNALSCVLRISSRPGGAGQPSRVALLSGDIERAQEARLVAEGAALKADLLLVPHHGSKTSSSAEFLDAVAPHLALVQSGYRNRFGHPAEAPLARYRERAIAVLDSPHCGAATWRSEMPTVVQCQRTMGLRYWHHVAP
jgi:competence protein ComEC